MFLLFQSDNQKIQHNVIIDSTGAAQLCDFGRSRVIGRRGYTTIVAGTGLYMAPELLAFEPPVQDAHESDDQNDSLVTNEEPFAPQLTKETDIYGFGMVTLEVILCPSANESRSLLMYSVNVMNIR